MAIINVDTGTLITEAQYNSLQARVQEIMGTGQSTFGYGQSNLSSSSVLAGQLVTATQLNNLFADIRRAHYHQTGNLPTNVSDVAVGDLIDAGTKTSPLGFMDYDAAIETISSNSLSAANNAQAAISALESSRGPGWNTNISYEIYVDFANANQRRFFFNSGGQFKFYARLTGGSTPKDTDWSTLLNNANVVTFNYTNTTTNGSGTGSTIGNYDLTTTYQQIFTKTGSGAYAANDYTIRAKREGDTRIWFQIQFNDDAGPNPNYDETVQGTITAYFEEVRATNATYVSVSQPTYTKHSNL